MGGDKPVLRAGSIASLIVLLAGAVVTMMVNLDKWILSPEQISSINEVILLAVALVAAIVGVASPWIASKWANRRVTPLDNPKDRNGVPLVSLADPRDIDGEKLTRSDNTPAKGGRTISPERAR
jgi:hypothetical protein